jgi:hypothetical protein
VTSGDAWSWHQPSWHQLLSGAHPWFPPPPARAGRGLAPRHDRGAAARGGEPAGAVVDLRDLHDWWGLRSPDDRRPDDAMGWADAAAWSAVLGGLAVVVAARVGDLVR